MKLYQNGDLVARIVTTIRPFRDLDPASNPSIGIGNHGGYPTTPHNFPFNGLVDELSVYDRALTQAQIRGIFNAGSAGKIKAANYFTADYPTVVEGSTGSQTPVSFTISRVGSLAGQAVVNWTTADGTATAGADYVAASGQLVFQNGESQKTVAVTVIGDNVGELDETFNLVLSTPTPGYGAGGSQATIVNDDPTLAISDATVTEGDTKASPLGYLVAPDAYGLATARDLRIGPDGNVYVASHDTDVVKVFEVGTGRFLRDLGTAGGELDGPWGMTFGPDGMLYVGGRYSRNVVRFNITSGAYDVFVSAAASGGLGAAKGLAFGPGGDLYVSGRVEGTTIDSVKRYSSATGVYLGDFVGMGSGGLNGINGIAFGPDGDLYVASTQSHEVKRYDGQTGAFLDNFIPAGSGGIANPTYLLFHNDGKLYVTDNTATKVFRYQATTGAFVDMFVSNPAGISVTGMAFAPTGEFYAVLGTPTLQSGSAVQKYGPPGMIVFTVTLAAPLGSPVTVDVTTANGSAVAGSDYLAMSGTITFVAGETSKVVPVTMLDDLVLEGNETFTVNLSNAVGATILDGQGVGTIVDDEATRLVSISDATATEGSHAAHYRGAFIEGAQGAHFFPPAFGPDGNFYTAADPSPEYNTIRRYNGTSGEFIDTFVPSGKIDGIRDIVFRSGFMYVGSEYTDEVLRFDATTGAFVGVFVAAGSGGIDGPHGLTFGPDKNGDGIPELYVTGRNSQNVVRYDGATGLPLGTYVTPRSGGLSLPEALTFDPSGTYLYVTSPGSNKILRYNAQTGAYVGVGASTGLSGPKGVKFGPDGLMYVASSGNNSIERFTANGAYVDDYVPAASGGLDSPNRLIFGPDGDLYVTSTNNSQILRYGTEAELVFTVSLSNPNPAAVTVQYATANGSALAGSDYVATSGTVVFQPGVTRRTIFVPLLDDAIYEGTESFVVNLSSPSPGAIITDGQGVATILDNELPPTRFYVVNDGSPDRTYEYSASGTAVENYAINSGNTAPRGATSTVAGTTVWVVDANKTVYVYNTSGGLLGSWTAGTLASNATVEGIATNGTDVWIVDAKQDKVFRYTGAASRLSGSQNAASSFSLNSSNADPKDIVTDGTSLWVVNDSSTDKVFKYNLSGTLLGSWTISGAGTSPTGITLDPASVSNLWIVDSGTDRIYQFDAAAGRTSGSQSPSTSFALAAGNTNPQGIADPPTGRSFPVTTQQHAVTHRHAAKAYQATKGLALFALAPEEERPIFADGLTPAGPRGLRHRHTASRRHTL